MQNLHIDDATQLASHLSSVMDDAEDLLRSTADLSDETVAKAREKFRHSVATVRQRFNGEDHKSLTTLRRAATAGDDYVRAYPWQMIGVGVALGLLVGVMSARH